MIKFSVVIPAYNASATLPNAIASCLDQTIAPYEIIIVDDMSGDDTLAIAKQHTDKAPGGSIIKLLCNSANLGPAATRNVGWDNATGDYVAFLDSDDQWHKEKLSRIQEILEDNPAISLLGHSNASNGLLANTKKISTLSLLVRNFAFTPNIVVRRDLKERFDEAMRYAEDHDLWLRIAQRHNAYVFDGGDISTTLGRRPLSEGGLSGDRYRMRTGEIYMYFKFATQSVKCGLYVPVIALVILAKLSKEALTLWLSK